MDNLPARTWVAVCSARLQQHWRTIDPLRLDDVAQDIVARDPKLRALPPEEAAVEWLRQGIPTVR